MNEERMKGIVLGTLDKQYDYLIGLPVYTNIDKVKSTYHEYKGMLDLAAALGMLPSYYNLVSKLHACHKKIDEVQEYWEEKQK